MTITEPVLRTTGVRGEVPHLLQRHMLCLRLLTSELFVLDWRWVAPLSLTWGLAARVLEMLREILRQRLLNQRQVFRTIHAGRLVDLVRQTLCVAR